jgi:hypothetical protein
VAAAVVLAQSVSNALATDFRFDFDHAIALSIQPGAREYDYRRDAWNATLRDIDRIAGIRATAKGPLPLTDGGGGRVLSVVPAEDSARIVSGEVAYIGPGYFSTVGIPLLAGRGFTTPEFAAAAPHVAVLSESFAQQLWPHPPWLDRTVSVGDLRDLHVVGIVPDAVRHGIRGPASPAVYVPLLAPDESRRIFFDAVARTDGDPHRVLADIQSVLALRFPLAANRSAEPAVDEVLDQLGAVRLARVVLQYFSLAALGVSLLSIYGTVHLITISRRRTSAIRMVLGASPRRLFGAMIGEACVATLVGCAAGAVAAAASLRLVSSLLFGVTATATGPFALALAVVVAATIVAGAAGARHLLSLSPSELMRDAGQ